MIVRIDTTNLTRGREFTMYAKNSTGTPVIAKAVDVNTGDVTAVDMQHIPMGEFDGYTAIAPQVDGYFMAKIGSQKVVKKIGNPAHSFALAYKPNYTVSFDACDGTGAAIGTGTLIDVGDGFYYTLLPSDTAIVKTINKNFIVNKNLLKMNYEITMDGGALNSTFENVSIDNVSLPIIDLPDAVLGDSTLDSTLPDITIKEL